MSFSLTNLNHSIRHGTFSVPLKSEGVREGSGRKFNEKTVIVKLGNSEENLKEVKQTHCCCLQQAACE